MKGFLEGFSGVRAGGKMLLPNGLQDALEKRG